MIANGSKILSVLNLWNVPFFEQDVPKLPNLLE